MAKAKQKKRKTPSKRRKSKQKKVLSTQFFKILISLCSLFVLVLAAGLLTNHILRQKRSVEMIDRHEHKQSSDGATFQFEIYPKEDLPAATYKAKPDLRFTGKLPKIAIIIDDIGYDRDIVKKFIQTKIPITFSILPQSPFQKSIAENIRKNGLDLMLHQPMEPDEYPRIKPGPGALLSSMSPDELILQLTQNIDALPAVKGVNNHMGSKITSNASQMRQIFSVLKKKGLFFIDSRTTTKTICKPSARLLQVPFGERDVFIDHMQDHDLILRQFKELVRIAQERGAAIGIAHPYTATYHVLLTLIPELDNIVEFVPVADLVIPSIS